MITYSTYRVFQGHETDQLNAAGSVARPADPNLWYWEPIDYDGDVLWSDGFPTREEACERAEHGAQGRHPENWTAKSDDERDAEIVRRLLAADERGKALEVARERGEQVWVADDGNAAVAYPDAATREEAARAYVEDGSWGDDNSTTDWVTIYTWPRYIVGDVEVDDLDDRYGSTVEIPAEEPSCADGHEHHWMTPYSVLGGIKENPGCWGHGGGVICNEICEHCGCLKTTDTWAQCRETGEQGLTGVTYAVLGDHDHSDGWNEWHRKRVLAAVEEAIEEAGYSVSRESDGDLIVPVTSGEQADGEDVDGGPALEEIQEIAQRHGCEAGWTGNGNTDAHGESTSDVRVTIA